MPVYKSEQIIPELVTKIRSALNQLGVQYEIILVDDGSSDCSWEVIQRMTEVHPNIIAINLMRNFGQHNALLCGIRAAKFDTIVTMDDDLQHPPESIELLLSKVNEGYDVVYGTPRKEKQSLLRNIASKTTKLVLQEAMGATTARNVCSFRAFRTNLRDAFTDYRSPLVSIDVLLTWGTSSFSAVRVDYDQRKIGKSTYTLQKLIVHALNMITGFSTWPLQLASLVGFGMTLLGTGVLLYVVVDFFAHGDRVRGFPFLASLFSIFAGAQLFALGIIGEYLARIYLRMMDQPAYVMRNI
ncbi:MAG: glycosyltransferase family 2 protein, partial [Pyrinomonadaceae bacterium]